MLDDSPTGRRSNIIEITPEMIEAGASEVIIDAGSSPRSIAYDVIVSALKAGGFKLTKQAENADGFVGSLKLIRSNSQPF